VTEESVFDFQKGQDNFLFSKTSRQVLNIRDFCLGIKRSERSAGRSSSYSVEIKNDWNYDSTLQYAFMIWCLFKQNEQLYLCYYRINLSIFITDSTELIVCNLSAGLNI